VSGADPVLARPLPRNLEAEASVLGAIVLDNRALRTAMQVLRASDFSLPVNQKLFTSMLQLGERSEPINSVSLMEHLETLGQLESIGGLDVLSRLGDGMPRVTDTAHYARIVKRKSVLRNLISSTARIQEEAFAAGDDVDVIVGRAKEAIAGVIADSGLTIEPADWRSMFHSYEDFENSAPLTFSIGGFLQNDGATFVGGLSGHGKTLILCSIAKALLAGKGARLWDLFPVEENAVRVMYLIPECSLAPFRHRLKLFGIYGCLSPNDDRLLVRTLSAGATPRLDDARILFAAKGAHVILDTAARFSTGDENEAGDNQRGLASDIFALLGAGARSVIAAHHSPKPFAKESVMRLENVLRGSGDIGAMLSTAWGVKQIDAASNVIHIENLKPRDFQPCGPFEIVGRPHIDDAGDFRLHKRPGECGTLADEQPTERSKGGGAPSQVREDRRANIARMQRWLGEQPHLSTEDLVSRFAQEGIEVGDRTVRKYRLEVDA